jgi:hypothetical protein
MTENEMNSLELLISNPYGWSKLEKRERIRNFLDRIIKKQLSIHGVVCRKA